MAKRLKKPELPELTERQAEYLGFAMAIEAEHGRAFKLDELARAADVSQPAASDAVGKLVEAGYVEQPRKGAHGGYVILFDRERNEFDRQAAHVRWVLERFAAKGGSLRLPILGTAAAGEPIEAVDEEPEYAIVDARVCGGHPCYVLRIRGDSMVEAGIADGSLVVVRAEEGVVSGAVHVCWLPGIGATVKFVRTGAEATELVASSKNYRPIQAPEGTIIQGRVVQVLTSMK